MFPQQRRCRVRRLLTRANSLAALRGQPVDYPPLLLQRAQSWHADCDEKTNRFLLVRSRLLDRRNRRGVFRSANDVPRQRYPRGESLFVSLLRRSSVRKPYLFQRSRRDPLPHECCGRALLATPATSWGAVPRDLRSVDCVTRSHFPQTRIFLWEATLTSALQ